MPVRIRLRRMGAKKRPFYRLVVANSTSPRDGRFIETLGYYDPLTEPATVRVDEEKALLWLSRGAQPSDRAVVLLKKQGILDKFQEQKAAGRAGTTEPPAGS
jgi:small subunit ribosomal protein S16